MLNHVRNSALLVGAIVSAAEYKTVDDGPVVNINWDNNKKLFVIDTKVKDGMYLDLIFASEKVAGASATSFLGIGDGVIVDKRYIDSMNAKIEDNSEYKAINKVVRNTDYQFTAFRRSTQDKAQKDKLLCGQPNNVSWTLIKFGTQNLNMGKWTLDLNSDCTIKKEPVKLVSDATPKPATSTSTTTTTTTTTSSTAPKPSTSTNSTKPAATTTTQPVTAALIN